MSATILLLASQTPRVSQTAEYVIGAIIALMILGYLLYSLIKPDEF